jgi:Acetyltransferase (GNAT) domain
MKCEIVDFEKADFRQLDSFADRTVFQTREWVRFVAETQGATPVLAQLTDAGKVVGYFTGLTFTRLGVKVLGSSFPGWSTPYMGFNLVPGGSRAEALAAVEQMAWNELKCLHIEVSDPYFDPQDGEALGFKTSSYISYRTDLTKPEDELFQSMDSACRRCVRKAEKSGVIIEEAHDLTFADEYYEQLKDVFAKQGLVPTYDVERVRSLVRNMEPSGNVLLLRARDPEGKCIASGIFPGFNQIVEFWGNASFRAYQGFRPNEFIQWYVMRYWKNRGATIYDWGGEGTYKEKYGCVPHRVPWLIKSRYEFVSKLRDGAKKVYRGKQRLMGWWQGDRAAVAGE